MAQLGRPSLFDEATIEKLFEYLKSCGREQTELPTIEGFAEYVDVDADTIGNWGKEHPDFFGAVKKLMDRQKNQLINDGLYGGKEVNQAMAIFLLKVNHGLIEKSALDVTTAGKPITQPLLGGVTNGLRSNDSNSEATETK